MNSNNPDSLDNINKIDNDVLTLDNTVCHEQNMLSADEQAEQAEQLNQSSMAHFKIIDILGKGGMGAVYKAKDLALERFVAIKMLRISETKQTLLLAEAKAISQLNHPNIVTVYDIARDGEANFIVMEWVDGQPLNSVIPTHGLALTQVLAYAKQMVAALCCAHQKGIIHRDIKPQNMMVDSDGRIKILDFGIAELLEPSAEKAPSAQVSENLIPENQKPAMNGSPQYMAPEQMLGQGCDARSDLFSLGIVLYEMLSGVKPFLGLNVKQIGQAITNGQYTPLPEINNEVNNEINNGLSNKQNNEFNSELIAVVDKLLQVEPEARYQSAQALAQDIDLIDEKINHKRNWWQQQHWLMKVAIVMPVLVLLSWSIRSVLFPPTTQELIARQLVESKKIAFLPFDNISGDPVLQIFSDGIATMLSSDLAEVGYQQGDGTTWVVPSSDVRNLDDQTISGIYNKYGVDFIVTGSIQHMGSTRSVHLHLVNGADGRQLKSIQLTIDAENLFAAQTDIRQQVMMLLGWKIPPSLKQQFAQKKPAFDGAYKHYLQGQGYLYRFDHSDNIEKALESFQAAIDLDVNYADAYVGLAEVQLRSFIEYQNASLFKQMENTVEQLKKIAASHPLLSYLQGELMLNRGEYQAAVKQFEQSTQQQPNFLKAYASLSIAYQELGELSKAERTLLSAYQLMPSNNAILIELGIFHFSNGNYSKAIEYFEKLAQQAPNNYIAYLNISACHYLNGNINNAILTVKQSLKIQPNTDGYANLGTYYFILRGYQKAVEAYEQMIALNDSDYIKWGNLADAYRFANNPKYVKAFNQAIIYAKQALELNPKDKKATASLAYFYANVDNIEKTIFYAKKISEKDLGEDHFFIAAAYARLSMNQAALKYLAFAINNNYSLAEISDSPLLDSLKNEDEYLQLIKY